MKLNPLSAAFAVALFLGLFHAAWAGLVAAGLALSLLDFIFHLHFLSQPFTVAPFDLVTAASLVGVTAGVGFVAGFIAALFWNAFLGKNTKAS